MHGIGKKDVITFWFLLSITVDPTSVLFFLHPPPPPPLLTSWVTLDMLCFTLLLSSPTDIINPVHYLRFMMTNILTIKMMRANYRFLSCATRDCISKKSTVVTCMELSGFWEQISGNICAVVWVMTTKAQSLETGGIGHQMTSPIVLSCLYL